MQESQRMVKLLTGELVYGNTDEILDYCKKHDTNVQDEYTHVTPSVVSKNFNTKVLSNNFLQMESINHD